MDSVFRQNLQTFVRHDPCMRSRSGRHLISISKSSSVAASKRYVNTWWPTQWIEARQAEIGQVVVQVPNKNDNDCRSTCPASSLRTGIFLINRESDATRRIELDAVLAFDEIASNSFLTVPLAEDAHDDTLSIAKSAPVMEFTPERSR